VTPVQVIRTIPKREIAGWFVVFGMLAVVAAGFAAIDPSASHPSQITGEQ
jgi:hypothetical protein